MTVEERDDAVVEKIGGGDRRLAIIELGESDLGVGVDEGLLVNPPNPLEVADIEGVLGATVTCENQYSTCQTLPEKRAPCIGTIAKESSAAREAALLGRAERSSLKAA